MQSSLLDVINFNCLLLLLLFCYFFCLFKFIRVSLADYVASTLPADKLKMAHAVGDSTAII